MEHYQSLYIGGTWRPAESGRTHPVINPYTEQVITNIPAAEAADIDQAVAAATEALPSWRQTAVGTRIELLRRIAEILAERTDTIAEIVSADLGVPLAEAKSTQVGYPLRTLAGFISAAATVPWQERVGTSVVVQEPIGVVGAITPWNHPLQQAIAKVGAALVAGCTVVLKPSEFASLGVFELTEAIHRAGVPAGVFNLLTGPGSVAGSALVEHDQVSMVSFTGSTTVGRRIATAAAATLKPVSLELGGKSPSVVLDDADLETAVTATAARCFGNSGQTCAALTRLLVPRARLGEAEEYAKAAADKLVLGDPMDARTTTGPLVSASQQARVRAFIESGSAEGARLITGGLGAPIPDRGFFVAPTVFSDVTSEMTIARNEIFGPVLSILPYDSETEAMRIANDTPYGLNAAVWSASAERAAAFASHIESGLVGINGGRVNLNAPFGGYKQSGFGREFGAAGIHEFLHTKCVNFTIPDGYWPPA